VDRHINHPLSFTGGVEISLCSILRHHGKCLAIRSPFVGISCYKIYAYQLGLLRLYKNQFFSLF
jgi:hypothetical protein